MLKGITIILMIVFYSVEHISAQDMDRPDTVSIQSGDLILKGLLWRPTGKGPFATVIFCHGSYASDDTTHDIVKETSILGPLFARKGYNYFVLFRRGGGLSKGQGLNSADLMEIAFKQNGQTSRNEVQLQQLETTQMQDMLAGIAYLGRSPDTDTSRMAIMGHSFGGSLTLLVAAYEPRLKAVVAFSPAGYSWNLSPPLRAKLISAVKSINAPIMIIHAQNDYSTRSGYSLDSVLNQLHKPHLLQFYPGFGNSAGDGHNIIFLNTKIWEGDVFKFLDTYLGKLK
jgi:carboxymethylenebutenolidase